MVISGRSQSTFKSYAHHLAQIGLHFGKLPTTIATSEIENYLFDITQRFNSPSNSYFKFSVYSLRFAYRMEGITDKYVALPSIKREKKLPVVLSRPEIKKLLAHTKLKKHKLLLGFLYGCGLRCFEVRNIHLSDLDFDRKTLHVRQGKGKKDRYVPLSSLLINDIEDYFQSENPKNWLFNGGDFDSRYSKRGIQWAVRQIAKKANIIKPISVHTLRHTFATHLLEDGLDIISIKELLGHSSLKTTMIYLHVAQHERRKPFSPLDTLYNSPHLNCVNERYPNCMRSCV